MQLDTVLGAENDGAAHLLADTVPACGLLDHRFANGKDRKGQIAGHFVGGPH